MNDAPRYSKAEMNQQTARVAWPELERHFARGVVIEVATCFANDDKAAVERWTNEGRVQHLDTETARRWSNGITGLWAVVIAPWVLVQERTE